MSALEKIKHHNAIYLAQRIAMLFAWSYLAVKIKRTLKEMTQSVSLWHQAFILEYEDVFHNFMDLIGVKGWGSWLH